MVSQRLGEEPVSIASDSQRVYGTRWPASLAINAGHICLACIKEALSQSAIDTCTIIINRARYTGELYGYITTILTCLAG